MTSSPSTNHPKGTAAVDKTGDPSSAQADLKATGSTLPEDHFPLEREQNQRHGLYSARDGEAATVDRPAIGG